MPSHDRFIVELTNRLFGDADPAALAAMLIRTGSVQGREILARAASSGELDYERLSALALRPNMSAAERRAAVSRAARVDPVWLLQAARVAALQGGIEGDPVLAMGLFELVYASHGADSFDRDAGTLYAQLLVRHGALELLQEVLPSLDMDTSCRWAVELDELNPFIGAGASVDDWLAKLNDAPFGESELEPVELGDALEPRPFDRLTATSPTIRSAEAITVIMPVYRPGQTIFTAVRSILAQSWDNLELLIVDDASPREYRPSLEELVGLDPRIRLLRAPVNRGTYAARNLGLAAAEGDFVTFQDCDDWSHPRRLEMQVAPLRELGTTRLATRSRTIRAFSNLTFTFPGYPPDRVNASSLLCRREAVTEVIGDGFDDVRKAADDEFYGRLEAVAPGSLLDLPMRRPLAIKQIRDDSLSRADALPGWLAWTRLAYRNAYTFWHSQISLSGASASLSVGGSRSIPSPDPSWDPVSADRAPRRPYDTVIINDWRLSRGSHQRAIGEIHTMIDNGLRVAVAHLETPCPLARRREIIARSVQELINSATVDLVHLTQPIATELAIVYDPVTLQFLPAIRPALETAKVAILCQSPDEGPELRYSVENCSANARHLFGRPCKWVPRSSRARAYLEDRLGDGVLTDFDLPPAFNRAPLSAPVRRPNPHRPVVGRHAGGHWSHWPAGKRDLLSAYPDDDRFDVRLMGDRSAVGKLLARKPMPPNWTWFDRDELSVRAFLAQLDFFVCFPHPASDIKRSLAALEAVASGCVAILDRRHEPVLGEAALYCEPPQTRDLILELYDSPDDFAEQQQRGWAWLETTENSAGFLTGLERLIGTSRPDHTARSGTRGARPATKAAGRSVEQPPLHDLRVPLAR